MVDEKHPERPGAVVIPFPGSHRGTPEPITLDIAQKRKAAVVGALRQALEAAYNNQLDSVIIVGTHPGNAQLQLHFTSVVNAASMVQGLATATVMVCDGRIP